MIEERFEYFRFLAPLPIVLTFPSATFEIALHSITQGANDHAVKAHEKGTAGYVRIGGSYTDRAWLEEAAYQAGVKVRLVTVGETIMRRLVRDGLAEIMARPADDPLDRRQRNPGKLYG